MLLDHIFCFSSPVLCFALLVGTNQVKNNDSTDALSKPYEYSAFNNVVLSLTQRALWVYGCHEGLDVVVWEASSGEVKYNAAFGASMFTQPSEICMSLLRSCVNMCGKCVHFTTGGMKNKSNASAFYTKCFECP